MSYCSRILMACIKYLGDCCCPLCLVRKSQIPLLGTDRDMRFREKNPRVDRPADVANAQRLLYEKGIALSNDSYDEILKFTSRVPTRVGVHAIFFLLI